MRAGVTEAAEEGLGTGVAEAAAAAAAEGLGAGVTEAEEEQAEETAETSEGAGRAPRAVLLGLLGVGVSATTRRRLVTSPSGAAFRGRLVAQDFGLVSDATGGAAALFEGLIVGVLDRVRGMGEREGEPGGEWGTRGGGEKTRKRWLAGEEGWESWRRRDRRGLQLYGLRWAMTQHVNFPLFWGFKIYTGPI